MVAILWRSAALLTVGCVLGFAVNGLRAEPVNLEPREETYLCETEPAVLTTPPEVAGPLCADGGVVILDVRSPRDFAKGHVAGAIHLPCREGRLEDDIFSRISSAHTVLVYGHNTPEAQEVAQGLLRQGVGNVQVIEGGFPAWEKAGQACSSGPCRECHGEGL